MWLFFHCIRTNRGEPYACKEVDNILSIKVPKIEADEHIIPLCKYTPKFLQNYFITQELRNRVKVKIDLVF
jgi:hypothetical protein